MKNSTKIILWLIFFFPYGLYLLIRQLLFKAQQQFDAQEEETKAREKEWEEKRKAREKEREEEKKARLAEQEKKKEENIKWQKKYGEKIAKQKMALAKAKREEHNKKLLAFKKKYGADATKALAGKIWTNMSFQLYREAQLLRPSGRKFGKKFENVVNGEERHKYRFDSYKNRQGKTSYNFEVDTKAGLITGWKNLEDN